MSIPTLGTISLDSDRTLLVPVDDLGGNAGARVDYALYDFVTPPGDDSLLWLSLDQIDSPQTVVTPVIVFYGVVWVRVSGRTSDGEQSTAFGAAESIDIGDVPVLTEVEDTPTNAGIIRIDTPTITGGNYTIGLIDTETWLRISDASLVTVTIPMDTEANNIVVGSRIWVEQAGAGAVTIIPETSLPVVNSLGDVYTTEGQWAVITLVKVAANEWTIYGRLIS